MPIQNSRIAPKDMDARQWATFLTESGVQAERRDVRTFTPSWTGFSVDPTLDLYYKNFGSIVAIWSPAINTGTSNGTTFLINNLPSELWPREFRNVTLMAIDNNVNVSASVSINTTGTMTFQNSAVVGAIVTFSNSGWTAASNKGFPAGATIMYAK